MFGLSLNIILQYIAVVIILIIAIIFIVKKIRKPKQNCCSECSLSDSCISKKRGGCMPPKGKNFK